MYSCGVDTITNFSTRVCGGRQATISTQRHAARWLASISFAAVR
jgi:hypothetical protein